MGPGGQLAMVEFNYLKNIGMDTQRIPCNLEDTREPGKQLWVVLKLNYLDSGVCKDFLKFTISQARGLLIFWNFRLPLRTKEKITQEQRIMDAQQDSHGQINALGRNIRPQQDGHVKGQLRQDIMGKNEIGNAQPRNRGGKKTPVIPSSSS